MPSHDSIQALTSSFESRVGYECTKLYLPCLHQWQVRGRFRLHQATIVRQPVYSFKSVMTQKVQLARTVLDATTVHQSFEPKYWYNTVLSTRRRQSRILTRLHHVLTARTFTTLAQHGTTGIRQYRYLQCNDQRVSLVCEGNSLGVEK